MTIIEPPPGFRSLDPNLPIRIYQRNLPHWRQSGATYFVTFRLADSLPASRLTEIKETRTRWEASHPEPRSQADWQRFIREMMLMIDGWLDAGAGSCLLRHEAPASKVIDALTKFDGIRYLLGAWVIMPNHVHAIVRPFDDAHGELEDVLQAWKGVSARRINKEIEAGGTLWQQETFDTLIRDPGHLLNAVHYIGRNPSKAGLPENSCPRWVHPEWADAGFGFQP